MSSLSVFLSENRIKLGLFGLITCFTTYIILSYAIGINYKEYIVYIIFYFVMSLFIIIIPTSNILQN